ncbi:TetR-like C-terminal domain-containing protein [Lentzea albida]|uniref:HTH-type transcriptional regulator MT1864/Rv1816-like C-terminal domain-containing protein n=1 Tax=Lentzea albida TaxID=65499 RepID=A0A1H9RU15_9PSEU|nr:TetR-like C-terminal domain-containing protein [Lentzea albida]SER76094.1 hypothetical protein SAMN04488000_111283 [Lentzea albida]
MARAGLTADRLTRAAAEFADRVAEAIGGRSGGGYDLGEPEQTDAVRLLHSTFHGYVSLERAGAFHSHPRGVEASWLRTLDALGSLLRSWPA